MNAAQHRVPNYLHMAHQDEDPIPELKRQLAQLVVERLERWNQVYAADFIGTDQPRMSDLRRGRVERFSLERLVRSVTRVDRTVRISVEWSARRATFFGSARAIASSFGSTARSTCPSESMYPGAGAGPRGDDMANPEGPAPAPGS